MELVVIRGPGGVAEPDRGAPPGGPPAAPGGPQAAIHAGPAPASPANSAASTAQQLDDGYGSSNSSPHSSGMISTSCGLISRHKGTSTPLHKPSLAAVVNIRENLAAGMGPWPGPGPGPPGRQSGPGAGFVPGLGGAVSPVSPGPSPTSKKDVQVEVADKGYKSYVVPTPSPEELAGSEDSGDSVAEDDAILDTPTPAAAAASATTGGSGGGGGGAGGGGSSGAPAARKKRKKHKKAQRKDVVVVTSVPPPSAPATDPERETWGRNADFLLSIIGFAVDLANVWRFPYLCYRNGGGAFLVPYTLMLVFGAVPLFYMELILGQYNRQGPISVWRVCPLFKGVGFCAVMVAFYVSFYYNVIIGWALYFMAASAAAELPWLHCNNTWNTEWCWESTSPNATNLTGLALANLSTSKLHHSPAAEYFHRGVLEMQWSEGLHDVGAPKWQLALCVGLVYCMLYLSLFKGVKSSGLVVWVTATMPYVVLTILLIRGLMLPGALTGIQYYLQPELARLQDTQVWVDAAVQIFYSVGAGFGVHLSYASYNHFDNNCYNDCLITTAVNCFTSFFSGFVIFTYLGFMSHKQGIHISNVATEGPGLVFQVYPEAVATLPGSHFWSLLFFFMLIMLGLDSAMGGMECVITGLMDEFHDFFHGRKYAREIFTLCAICVSFCVALINVTPGGIYMFHLFDTYSAGISLLCSALFEAIAVSWFYGLERFSQDVHAMLGFTPGLYWRICWKFISPLFIIGVVMFGLLYHQPLQYNEYHYPAWAELVGWGLAMSSIVMIPLVAIMQLCKTPGSFKERLAINISPVEEHDHIRRTKEVTRFKARHWLYV